MNIILLQGNDELTIRQRLSELKSKAKAKGFSIRYLPTPSLGSLFETKTLFILEGSTKLSKTDQKWLSFNLQQKSLYLIAVVPGVSETKLLTEIDNNLKVERYDLPKIIFNWLESFYPHNAKACIKLFHQLLSGTPVEYLFNLLSRHLVNLYWAKRDPATINQAPWKLAKLKQQSQKYKPGDLKAIIQQLAETDLLVKTSRLDMASALDHLIIRRLQ